MAIPTTAVHVLRLLMQAEENLSGLQRDIVINAQGWRAAAIGKTMPVTDLASAMNSAAVEYQRRLQWVTDAQANTAAWSALSAMWSKLGGTGADFSGIFNPLNAVATQLPAANKASYNSIITACDSILSAVSMPLSLWPE